MWGSSIYRLVVIVPVVSLFSHTRFSWHMHIQTMITSCGGESFIIIRGLILFLCYYVNNNNNRNIIIIIIISFFIVISGSSNSISSVIRHDTSMQRERHMVSTIQVQQTHQKTFQVITTTSERFACGMFWRLPDE